MPAEKERSVPATSFAVSTERVKVDVVVRDRKDAILRGLTAADLELYEDGVRQNVDSFEFVERRRVEPAGALTSAAGALAPAAAATPPAFVAVAFDRLSPAARSFAQQAALGYVEHALPARSWTGVFSIDRGLSTLQPFTDDRDALRRSLDRAARGAPASFAGLRERDAIRNAYAGLATGFGQAHVAAAELSGVPECRSAEDEVVRRMEILESRLMESF
ncbi:MAG TPA: VWA domain-containing protein, partial [Vicinamibacteria bacterium]